MLRLLWVLLPLFVLACDDTSTSSSPPACTPGIADCPCDAAGGCADGAFCAGGICRVPRCDAGEEGCACLPDETCGLGGDGRPLTCAEGTCRATPCTVGALDCACGAFGACAEGLFCADGVCADPGCTPGELDCLCNGDACSAGLVCQDARCVDPGCTLGTERCACVDGGCQDGLLCRDGQCVSPCPAGSPGCACDGAQCNPGLTCIDATCVTCTPGDLGCACAADDTCAAGQCSGGICRADACDAGTEGCVCDNGSCGANLRCSAQDVCTPCPDGARGCGCADGACADPALDHCVADVCTPRACVLGTEGCACDLDGACGLNDRGESMACTAGLCVAPSCAPGDTGCACRLGDTCDSANDACFAGFCQPRGCAAGAEHCACVDGACGEGLSCRAGAVCTSDRGFIGGPCQADGGCNAGGRCEAGRCVDCRPGALGCGCVDGACLGGLACEAGACVEPDEPLNRRVPPLAPRCYTPCTENLIAEDGSFRRCPADGLMSGCVGGRECNAGSCVSPGAAKPACAADHECPDWQICIQGGCYSNCTRNADCAANEVCDAKVCRSTCSTREPGSCGVNAACESVDGELGTCHPLVPDAPANPDAPLGALALNRAHIRLTAVSTTAQFVLSNTSDRPITATIRKRSHILTGGNGPAEAEDLTGDCDANCPLFWLRMGTFGGEIVPRQRLEVQIAPGADARIVIEGADGVAAPRWQGELIVESELNPVRVALEYAASLEGAWAGNIFYFGVFGDAGLDAWRALPNPAPGGPVVGTRDDANAQLQIGNALLQRWGAFRRQRISYDEFEAVLNSTVTESWRQRSVRDGCGDDAICYPFHINALGLREYTTRPQTVPVPSGVVEMPFAMNLRAPDPADPTALSGRIDSRTALHMPGDPAIDVQLAADPATCSRELAGTCINFVEGFDAVVAIGGRREGADCAPDALDARPWLVPGFARATELDPEFGDRIRSTCRDDALSLANPVPDGRARVRTIELIDGALVDQTTLFILFRERFDSFLDPEGDAAGFATYGMIRLRRQAGSDDTTDDDQNGVPDQFEGTRPAVEAPGASALAVQCDPDLIDAAIGQRSVTAANASDLAHTLIEGVRRDVRPAWLDADSAEQPHYLCVDTGLFDAGAGNATPNGIRVANDDSCGRINGVCEDGGDAAVIGVDDQRIRCALGTDTSDCGPRFADDEDDRVPCPAGSEVIYFTVDRNRVSQADIAALPCQQDGSCADTLALWRNNPDIIRQSTAAWVCADPNASLCSDDRANLRLGKRFLAQQDESVAFEPLVAAVDRAFRYKTRFVSDRGDGVGFVPQICNPDASHLTPYCYDPAVIEGLRDRVDCLLAIHGAHLDRLSIADRGRLVATLQGILSYVEQPRDNRPVLIRDGFERLYAELLGMLGDDALTRAFSSRFDLAGEAARAFPGSRLETDGFDLAGPAGAEMHALYQATQYYGEALDRFYAMSPTLWQSLQNDAAPIVTSATVTWYFERLVRLSVQRSRAWAEIAGRYQRFNRPDLARRVAGRAYVAAHLESIVMERLLLDIVDAVGVEEAQAIRQIRVEAQGRSTIALNTLRDAFVRVTDDEVHFGLAPDAVPLPPLDSGDFRQSNAFELLLARLRDRMQLARQREDRALADSRAFDTDEARFQSELASIRTTYEDQLAEICGAFVGDDGVVYPAIAAYADKSEATLLMGDPCGLLDDGSIHEARVELELRAVDLRRVMTQIDNVIASVEIERDRASQQCDLAFELADYQFRRDEQVQNAQQVIRNWRFLSRRIDRGLNVAASIAGLISGPCNPLPACKVARAVKAGLYGRAAAVVEAGALTTDLIIAASERQIEDLRQSQARWETEQGCETLTVDANANMATKLLQLKTLELEALRLDQQVNLGLAAVTEAQARARRLQQQQAEAEQLRINAQAAYNNPTVRILRNASIINADVAYDNAMQTAWALTRVFEYYTSQTYAEKERLFFIRLISQGPDNLERYVEDLVNAFEEFEQTFGLPNQRVMLLSLKDDILRVPRVGPDGEVLSSAERTAIMRDALADPRFLDSDGYIRLPFETRIEDVSPVTRVHKIVALEADIIASDFGDHVARLYVRQSGTGHIRGVDGGDRYHRLPPRTAVLNPFFNGGRDAGPFDSTIYRNSRLRDRPLINTAWDLIINRRSEEANADLNLQSLTDIRLFIYYSDFTAWE